MREMRLFGIDTLCSILSNCIKNKSGIKINVSCISLFYVIVLCIYLLSRPPPSLIRVKMHFTCMAAAIRINVGKKHGFIYSNIICISVNIGEIVESLFYYEAGADHASLTDLNFVPAFDPVTNPNVNQTVVLEVCGTNEFCIYDFQTTGSQSFAQTTVETFDDFQTAIQNLSIRKYSSLHT